MTSENTEVPAQVEELRFWDPAGRRLTWTVLVGGPSKADDTGMLATTVTAEDGRRAVKKWLPTELVSSLAGAFEALENEARAGIRIAMRYPANHPAELVELIGHDLDGPEPFVLVDLFRGEPVDHAAWQTLDERHAFQESLLRAVLLLSEAEVVHGNLSTRTVRWNGNTVRIGDFGRAAVVGDQRTPRPDVVHGPPEQRRGSGVVTGRDDIWAAGLVLLEATTGQGGPLDLANRGAATRILLDGVFAEHVDARPTAAVLLGRLNGNASVPPPDLKAKNAHIEGARAFDRALAEKWPRQAAFPSLAARPVRTVRSRPVPSSGTASGKTASRRILAGWPVVVLVLVVLLVVFVVLVVLLLP